MKSIAFIDHNPVAGGIIRFGTNLAAAIRRIAPGIRVTFFTTEINYLSNEDLFTQYRDTFEVRILKTTRKTYTGSMFIDATILRLLGITREWLLRNEIRRLTRDYDIVYFTNGHASQFIGVGPRSFSTFHDMLWKYQFGMPLFSSAYVSGLDSQMRKWFEHTHVVVSTPFVRSEILRFFPDIGQQIDIVYLPNLARRIESDAKDDGRILRSLGIDRKYILYPSHLMPHKNHQNLFSAFHRLMQDPEFKDRYMLVITGSGTDHFRYGTAMPMGVRLSTEAAFDILGLGYLKNAEIDAVIRNATLVISTSFYEAGSGPALDAWVNKVPVIISNIESHMDQLRFFGIECETFDPTEPGEISAKMAYALRNLDKLRGQSTAASAKFDEYTWEAVAAQYLDIFRKKAG